jgi:translation initiation factor IF-2
MHNLTFDRLSYIDILKTAGVEEPVARAHASALDGALHDSVATKEDVEALGRSTRADIEALKWETKGDIEALRRETKEDIAALKWETKGDIEALKKDVLKLDMKVEMLRRDLTIRLGAMIFTLGGVLIGIKYLG